MRTLTRRQKLEIVDGLIRLGRAVVRFAEAHGLNEDTGEFYDGDSSVSEASIALQDLFTSLPADIGTVVVSGITTIGYQYMEARSRQAGSTLANAMLISELRSKS